MAETWPGEVVTKYAIGYICDTCIATDTCKCVYMYIIYVFVCVCLYVYIYIYVYYSRTWMKCSSSKSAKFTRFNQFHSRDLCWPCFPLSQFPWLLWDPWHTCLVQDQVPPVGGLAFFVTNKSHKLFQRLGGLEREEREHHRSILVSHVSASFSWVAMSRCILIYLNQSYIIYICIS